MKSFAFGLVVVLAFIGAASAQMEKRDAELYDEKTFLMTPPVIGSAAPELTLADLDGRLHALSSLRGKVVVIIKGGYT